MEPEHIPDEDEGLEILYKPLGNVLHGTTKELPPRTDIVSFDAAQHEKEFQDAIQWGDCPTPYRQAIENLIKRYWDVFAVEGLKKPIRGYEFNIDTGTSKPICCKIPRYGPHETRVINQIVEGLQANGVIEDDDGPWGAMVVLAAKPDQAHKHWAEFIWRLCVSYRKLNTITRPFIYPARRCDDAVRALGLSRFYITMDLYWGFWQVALALASRSKTAFFIPGGKSRWTRMPMGGLNSHGAFCAIVDSVKRRWSKKFAEKFEDRFNSIFVEVRIKDAHSADAEVIVDDLMLHSTDAKCLIEYFQIVLETLQHFSITVNLKKCRFFPTKAEFVGIDVTPDGNVPAESKNDALMKMCAQTPNSTTDLRRIIGFFGFYQEWIPWYEIRISRWRQHLKDAPPTEPDAPDSVIYMRSIWKTEDDELLQELLAAILERPVLARPNYDRRFYLKTDWSKFGMGAVVLQADPIDPAALAAEEEEIKGTPCVFDKTLSNRAFRLLPVAFASRQCTKSEASDHSYTGEAFTGRWGMRKFKIYLWSREFTWLCDCSGLEKFFEAEDLANHPLQRARQDMLRFHFTFAHRPERMMVEVDTLSRYNRQAQAQRDQHRIEAGRASSETASSVSFATATLFSVPAIPFAMWPVKEAISQTSAQTMLSKACSVSRTIWDIDAAMSTTDSAAQLAGFECILTLETESKLTWNKDVNVDPRNSGASIITPYTPMEEWRAATFERSADWIVINVDETWSSRQTEIAETMIVTGLDKGGTTAVMVFTVTAAAVTHVLVKNVTKKIPYGWTWHTLRAEATNYGAAIESDVRCHLLVPDDFEWSQFELVRTPAATLAERLPGSAPPAYLSEHSDKLPEPIIKYCPHHDDQNLGQNKARMIALAKRRRMDDIGTPIFDTEAPAPKLTRGREIEWRSYPFAILAQQDDQAKVRGIHTTELLDVLGFSELRAQAILQNATFSNMNPELKDATPAEFKAAIFAAIKEVEDRYPRLQGEDLPVTAFQEIEGADETLRVMLQSEIRNPLSLALPDIATWKDATALDPDMSRLVKILKGEEGYSKLEWNERSYMKEYENNRLEEQDGLIYRYEASVRRSLRQIRALLVPPSLRSVVTAACHSTPMAGHMDEHKTLWRIASRFWWPMMARDTTKAVRECAHCRVSNITSHEAQQILKTVTSDCPFDVMSFDIWKPGDMPSTLRPGKSKTVTMLLTGMCVMTGHAAAGFIEGEGPSSEEVTRVLFTHFIAAYGLPKLIIIDKGSEFMGLLVKTCDAVGIKYHAVSRENHKAVLVERFHRYLNKVQKIHAMDCETFDDWLIGTIFAIYAWNSAPVDGTDIVRSYAALGREFPFPIDTSVTTRQENDNTNYGELTIAHVEGAFPLLFRQRELLKILIRDRREYHRSLRNKDKHPKTFAVGDLVLIRKQVQTSIKKGPQKLQMSARGPYRVLETLSENTYTVCKLPFDESVGGRPGIPYKESAARMEKLPSQLVIHRHTDGTDSNWANYKHAFVPSPLQHTLGALDFGRFHQVNNQPYAYEPIADLWGSLDDEDAAPEQPPSHGQPPDLQPALRVPGHIGGAGGERSPKRVKFNEPTPGPARHPRVNTRSQTVAARRTEEQQAPLNYKRLVENIISSRDKMLFIWYQQAGTIAKKWYLVEARLPDADAIGAFRAGCSIHVRFYVRNVDDSKKLPGRLCRQWPEIHELRKNGTFGRMLALRPGKVKGFLEKQPNYAAYEKVVQIQDQILWGPFNFAPPKDVNNRSNIVRTDDWERFKAVCETKDIDTSTVDTIVPLL
jgi:hypothetical protein